MISINNFIASRYERGSVRVRVVDRIRQEYIYSLYNT